MARRKLSETNNEVKKPRAPQKRVFNFVLDTDIAASLSNLSGTERANAAKNLVVAVFTDARKMLEFMDGDEWDHNKHARVRYEIISGGDTAYNDDDNDDNEDTSE